MKKLPPPYSHPSVSWQLGVVQFAAYLCSLSKGAAKTGVTLC